MTGRRARWTVPAAAGLLAALAALGAALPGESVSAETPAPAGPPDGKPPVSWHAPYLPDAPDTTGSPVVLRRAWPVMGTLLELTAVAPDTARARAAVDAGRAEVFRLDSLLSTYRRESEVSRLNAAAGTGRWTRLSPATAAALRRALRWAERTGGAVDPTVGPLVGVWGFRGRRPAVPGEAALDSAHRLVGWEKVEVRGGGRRARLPRDGMRLDFGAVGKGMALERAAEAMREAGATGGMADLGGQVSVFGRPPPTGGRTGTSLTGGRADGGGAPDEGGWRLGIRHPRSDGRLLGTLALDSGSVTTSGDTEQFFERDGVRYSHIMDARAGRPARGVAQVTVVAPNGTTADALATALFVMGPARGREWLRRHDRFGGGAGLSLVLWIRDPDGGPICPAHVVRAGPRVDRVDLRIGDGCAERP